MTERSSTEPRPWRSGGWWVENLLRPMLIAGMMVCLVSPAVQLFEWLMEGWNGTYFVIFLFFACLEGILSERVLQRQRITGWGYLGSRAAEALLLLLLLKLINYIPLGLDRLLADARVWLVDLERLVTIVDFYTIIVFLPLWAGSLYIARMVMDLDVEQSQADAPPDKTSTEYYLWMTQPFEMRDRQATLTWLSEIFMWGGAAILLVSAMIYFLLSTSAVAALPILFYFALGVALLSQARFSVAQAGWRIQGIPVQAGITRRWLLWAAVFLVAVALGAALLPTSYAMGPLQSVLYVISFLVVLIAFGLNLLLFLLMLPLAALFPSLQRPQRPTALPWNTPGVDPTVPSAQPPWLDVLVSFLFWATVLAIVGYALMRFLRDRLGVLDESEDAQRTWWGRLLMWLRDLWRRWRAWRSEAQAQRRQRRAEWRAERSARVDPFRFLSLGQMSPRELVRYFYVSTARRAAQIGRPRGPGQTPYEYQADLGEQFPDLESDLTGLTDAFVQARYSSQPVQPEDAEAVKPLSQRIKAALKRRRFSSRPDSENKHD